MDKYRINVFKTYYENVLIELDANNEKDAESKAMIKILSDSLTDKKPVKAKVQWAYKIT